LAEVSALRSRWDRLLPVEIEVTRRPPLEEAAAKLRLHMQTVKLVSCVSTRVFSAVAQGLGAGLG